MLSEVYARNHLLITDSHAVSGLVSPVAGRLLNHLRNWSKPRLLVKDALVVHLHTGESETSGEVYLPARSLILAHEYVDLASDPHLRTLHEPGERISVRLGLSGIRGASLRGQMDQTHLDGQAPYFVLHAPKLIAPRDASRDLVETMKNLRYIIVNRDRINLLLRQASP